MRPLIALSLLVVVACSGRPKGNDTALSASPHSAPSSSSADAAPPMGTGVTGTVLEKMPASGYVYLRLKTAEGEVWAAVNEVPVEVGKTVAIQNAMLMQNFESKTLGRTFDKIWFGSLEGPASAAMPGAGSAPPSMGTPAAPSVAVGKIERASGADARTIGELYAQKEQLAGKSVTIRGAVVKYNAQVMGKNWLHLQDGSGDASKGTHDITVTSMDEGAVGTTVTITGIVRTNRDFGAGYSYPVIVEEAKVVKK